MIYPPHNSDIEPGRNPNVLDGQCKAQNQFHRQRQQHAHGEKLKRQILQHARSRQELLFKRVLREKIAMPRLETKEWSRESELLEVNGHQPVEEERTDDIKAADDKHSKNK